MQMVTSVQLVILLIVTSFQSNSRATHPISRVHASNITCQKLQWSEIEPPTIIQNAFHAFRIKKEGEHISNNATC